MFWGTYVPYLFPLNYLFSFTAFALKPYSERWSWLKSQLDLFAKLAKVSSHVFMPIQPSIHSWILPDCVSLEKLYVIEVFMLVGKQFQSYQDYHSGTVLT